MGFSLAKGVAPFLIATSGLSMAPVVAQGPPDKVPVRYTEARSVVLRGEVRLPGTVESRLAAVVAGEVAGKVLAIEAQDGDSVRMGDVLVRIRPNWYELRHKEAQARLKESRARLQLAESSLSRARELFDAQVLSQQDLDDAISEFTAWQGRESQNQAQIEQLELSLNLLEVRAPFDGVVTRKLTEVGQWIASGGGVAEMVSLDRLEIRIDVAERYYDALRLGAAARITFGANGAVVGRRLVSPSGNGALDTSVVAALERVSRIEGLTADFLRSHKGVVISFEVE